MNDTTTKMTTINNVLNKVFVKVANLFKTPAYIFLIGLIFYFIYMIAAEAIDTHEVTQRSQMNAICPALFSITRSARDTLIVMKAEPLCNTYILQNLK
jgi:hypothetical protein